MVASSIITTFGLFYFLFFFHKPTWRRYLVLSFSLVHLVLADAKQVALTFLLGMVLLALVNLGNIRKAVCFLMVGALLIGSFGWAIYTFPILGAFQTWIRPELYVADGEATLLKTAGIRIILDHYDSALNWLVGLGPGHTVDRLGFTILKQHSYILKPLGATISNVSLEVQAAREASWLGARSSFFSPFWGWAAIWGDLGILGLVSYLHLGVVTWRKLCLDDFLKLVLMTVVIHGFIFTQLEEPAYMLFIATLVGLRWQQRRLQNAV